MSLKDGYWLMYRLNNLKYKYFYPCRCMSLLLLVIVIIIEQIKKQYKISNYNLTFSDENLHFIASNIALPSKFCTNIVKPPFSSMFFLLIEFETCQNVGYVAPQWISLSPRYRLRRDHFISRYIKFIHGHENSNDKIYFFLDNSIYFLLFTQFIHLFIFFLFFNQT